MNAIELLCRQHADLVGLMRDRAHDPRALDLTLRVYLDLEHEHFFPLLELHAHDELLDGIEELVDRTFLAHEELEEVLVEHMACALDDPELSSILNELLSVAIQHFADQQQDLYPLLCGYIPAEVFDELGVRMLARLERGSSAALSQSPEA